MISPSTLPFDPDRLRDKYRRERDRRLREVGKCMEGQVREVEAEQEWIDSICKPGVLRRQFLEKRSEQDGFYGAGSNAFVKVLEGHRADDGMKGCVRH